MQGGSHLLPSYAVVCTQFTGGAACRHKALATAGGNFEPLLRRQWLSACWQAGRSANQLGRLILWV
jgi:hypothetical protein